MAILVSANMLIDAAPEISRIFRIFIGVLVTASLVAVLVSQYIDYRPCYVDHRDPISHVFGDVMTRTQVLVCLFPTTTYQLDIS